VRGLARSGLRAKGWSGGSLHLLYKLVPCARWLSAYNYREDLQEDVIAGATVGVMIIPQARSQTSPPFAQRASPAFAAAPLTCVSRGNRRAWRTRKSPGCPRTTDSVRAPPYPPRSLCTHLLRTMSYSMPGFLVELNIE
jgi:hypothetical protein